MDFEETIGMYPHYYGFMRNLAAKAQQKREDRQIREEFGNIDEEEYFYKLEQVKHAK